MVQRFADLASAGRVLAAALAVAASPWESPVLVAALPNGVPVAIAVAESLGWPLLLADVHRDGEARVDIEGDVAGRVAVLVDDGVETGTVATAAAAALRGAGAHRLVLAVPVCPREARARLDLMYDEVHAVVQPLGRRALHWHFDTLDRIDVDTARARAAEWQIRADEASRDR